MASKPPFGFNFLGCASGNFGEAAGLRNAVRVLLANGYKVAIRNFETGDSRSGQDTSLEYLYIKSPRAQPYAVNIHGFGPPTFEHLLVHKWLAVPFEKRINVMFPAWELDVLPPSWVRVFEAMDVLLISSAFVADTIRRSVPDVPIIRIYPAVYPPDDVAPDRARWDMPDDEIVFFSAFDVTSDLRRKNPWGAIKAFQLAFPARSGQGADEAGAAASPKVSLLVKLHNAGVDPSYDYLVDELEAISAADPRIRLLDEQLSYRDVLSLYASTDVFVSLHRAEGLGLVLMEAMSLGKPVIATGYSGSMDFTSAENAALVDFELVPVDALHHDYQDEQTGGGARWAEPSVDSAAEWMVRLASDASLRARLGEQAAKDIEARRVAHMAGGPFREIEEFARTYDLDGEVHRLRARRLRAIRRAAVLRYPLRAARAIARRLRRAIAARSGGGRS